MADNITIPSSRVEFIDPRTGMISREWFLFFLKLSGGSEAAVDDLALLPNVVSVSDQLSEVQKSIQDVELSIVPSTQGDQQSINLGYLNVTDFGVDGSATDAANMAVAIAAAISQGKKLYAPQMVIYLGTSTMVFPETVPVGFSFECDPGCMIVYTGTGDAVTINSAGFCSYKFGGFFGYGGANAIRINPANPSASIGGQTAVVCCDIVFNTIVGFYCGVYADNGVGNVAQNNITGVCIIAGQGGVAAGSMTGYSCCILADGRAGGVYQGNIWNVNYIECDPPSFAAGMVWIGIQDGSATLGDTNNVNTYQYGAIDAITWPLSYGVNSHGNRNVFIGPIVDIHICFQLGAGAYFLYILAGSLSTFGGGGDYQIFDGSTVTPGWHWTWIGASDGRTGNLVSGVPAPKTPPFMVCNPTAYPVTGGVPVVIPMAAVGSGGTGLTIVGGGVQVATAGFYSLTGGCNVVCGGAAIMQIGIAINGVGVIVSINTATAAAAGMSTSTTVYLAANDIVYLGAASNIPGAVAGPLPSNFLSVIGPI